MGDSSQGEGYARGDDDGHILLQDNLIDEFRAKLDDTLIIAIIGDFDLAKPEQLNEVRGILEGLAQHVTTEEASGLSFNPVGIDGDESGNLSGPGGLAGPGVPLMPDSSDSSRPPADWADCTDFTDFSDTLSERFATLEFPKDVNVATLDEDGKVAELHVMFPLLAELDIKLALKKYKGDFVKACEDLLNMQYLEENGLRPKGIEGAFHQDGLMAHKGRSDNAKDKGKNRLDIDYHLTPVDLSGEDRTISTPVIPTSTSVPATRRNSLPRIIPGASYVAQASVSSPDSPTVKPTQWQVVPPKRKVRGEVATPSPAFTSETTSIVSEQLAAARRARARGGYYRTAAFVLAERAREQGEIVRAAESNAYEAMVDQTSTGSKIDLHGLPVADGVRIALERTRLWWDNLGENRERRAREEEFTVVTGLGNHNSGGVSRMRQEVGAALRRDGWRFTTGTGQYIISGKA